ncbi:MAG: CRISPR-associated protein Cas4 [Leptospiraceae bacterium]|nr:CRISPR-associated protein Cas4 [Leptospiraceae bacterium]MCP5496104.1 CRISPR-associated protein Cas4 [Leptospiraceae bacterium]
MLDWSEDEIIPISAISHHVYCPRQNALIHIGGVFEDNELTVSGNIGHEFVDEEKSIEDHGVHKETSLPVYSDTYGIRGIADIVEFPKGEPPFPIDYKNGKVSSWQNHEAQLCALAICLEEMLQTIIHKGAIYHIQSKKRHEVDFTGELRELTLRAILEIRELFLNMTIPKIPYSKKCNQCSLYKHCLPELNTNQKRIDIFKPVNY